MKAMAISPRVFIDTADFCNLAFSNFISFEIIYLCASIWNITPNEDASHFYNGKEPISG